MFVYFNLSLHIDYLIRLTTFLFKNGFDRVFFIRSFKLTVSVSCINYLHKVKDRLTELYIYSKIARAIGRNAIWHIFQKSRVVY